MTLTIETRSARETKAWGRRLASLLEGGELLGLRGDLGAGKTCFVKGLARGLNLSEADVRSPTFTMIQEHRGRLSLYHIDLYRLESAGIDDLGLREYLFSSAVAAVEWFERLREGESLDFLLIAISLREANCRLIEFSAHGPRHAVLLERLARHRG